MEKGWELVQAEVDNGRKKVEVGKEGWEQKVEGEAVRGCRG